MLALWLTLKAYASAHATGIAGIGAYALLEWVLPRIKFVKANSGLELLANLAKKALADRVPLVGRLVTLLATPQPAALPLPPGSSLRVLLPLAFVAIAMTSCAGVDWKKFGVDEAMCLAAPVKSAIGDVSSDLVTSIEQEIQGGNGFDSAQWKNDAQALGLKYGFGVVACAAEHLVGDLFIAGPAQVCKLNHKQAKPAHLAYLRKLLPKR